jgi:hypothetical protein
MSREVGPRRVVGLDSFNRELVRSYSSGRMVAKIVDADMVYDAGGGLHVSVS